MIVPTYTNTAKNVTGVAGQQFGFKYPAGALSAPMVAEANAWQDASTKAAQAGGHFLQQYHNTAVSKAYVAAAPQLDALALEAAQRDPFAKLRKDRPVPYYNRKSAEILKTAQGVSWWPTTETAIASKVGGHIMQARRGLQKAVNTRLMSEALGELENFRQTQEHQIAIGMTSDWRGDPEKLKPTALIAFNSAIKASDQAARSGIISFADHEAYKRELLSDTSAQAIEQRMLAADDTNKSWASRIEETQALLAEVSDNTNWSGLVDVDRLGLKKQLQNQLESQIRQEEAEERRIGVAERRETKDAQTQAYGDAVSSIFAYMDKKPGAKEVTVRNLLELEAKNLITGTQLTALKALLENKIPTESNLALVDDMQRELADIAGSDASPQEVDQQTNAVLDRLSTEIAKGTLSEVSRSDYQAIHSTAKSLRENRGLVGGWNDIDRLLKEVARKGKEFTEYADAPRYLEAIAAARQRFFQGGANAEAEALQRGLNILAADPTDADRSQGEKYGPSYPKFLPLPKKLGITTADPEFWTDADLNAAWEFYEKSGWSVDIPSQLNVTQRDNLFDQLRAIQVWLQAEAQRKAAADRSKEAKQ